MMYPVHVTGVILLLASLVVGDDRYSFDGGVLIQMFEWKWNDIANECENFFKPYGISGVVISPPTENIIKSGRPWFERYQPVSYKLETRSGNREELKNMLRRCNNVNVRVIADAVFNHMTGNEDNCKGTGGSECYPNRFEYPAVGYKHEHFHHNYKDINYQNAWEVRNHELSGLHDLDQKQEFVRGKIVDYLNDLVNIGFAGFRIDAAKHMDPEDLEAILGRVTNLKEEHGFPSDKKPFVYLEVIDQDHEAVKYSEYTHLGKVTDFRYGSQLGIHLRQYNGKKLKDLVGFGHNSGGILPNEKTVVFVDNHDTQHMKDLFPNHIDFRNSNWYKMAVGFMLAYDWSIPILMSSYSFTKEEEGPPANGEEIRSPVMEGMICDNGQPKHWNCEHRWRQIYKMVEFHNVAKGSGAWEWWNNGNNAVGFCRVQRGYFAISLETKEITKKNVKTCLPQGTYCDVINGELKDDGSCSGAEVVVDEEGKAEIKIPAYGSGTKDSMLAFHIHSKKGFKREKNQDQQNNPPPQQQNNPPPQQQNNPPPQQQNAPHHQQQQQNQNTKYDAYERGETFESGITRSGENVEITLKVKLSREWLSNLLKNTAQTYG